MTPGKKEEEYRHQLGSFGVSGDLALRPIASLSGGQKSRLAFALLAMPRQVVWILELYLKVQIVRSMGNRGLTLCVLGGRHFPLRKRQEFLSRCEGNFMWRKCGGNP